MNETPPKQPTMQDRERERRWEIASAARMKQIVPGLFLGNVKASYKPEMLQENHINAMVSLTDARWVWWSSLTREAGVPEHRHKWVQCADSSTQDLLVHLSEICDFIDQMASSKLSLLSSLPVEFEQVDQDQPGADEHGSILIHCGLGVSRSPTVIAAYLMRKLRLQQVDVMEFLLSKQRIKPSQNFNRQLQVWEEVGYQVWEDEEKTIPKPPYKAFLEDRAALLKRKGLTGNEPLAPLNLL